jgi:alpha-beta hydrolase superfamily lysophospholipase
MINIYPGFTEKAELDAAGVSRDPEEVKKYNADPYNHGKITAGMFFGFFHAGQWALAHAAELKTPLLLMHGTADRLTSPEGTKEFAAAAPKELVTLKLWDGFYHELHNEPVADRTQVFTYLINWLNTRVQAK